MAGDSRIRWTEIRRKRLAKSVADYNRKIEQAIKRYGKDLKDMNLVPEKIDLETVEEQIKTERDYQRIAAQLKSLRSLQQLEPIQIGTRLSTTYTQERIRIKEQRVNAQRRQLLEKVKLKAEQAGRFPTEQSDLLKEIEYTHGDPRNYEKLLDWLDNEGKRSRSEQWRQNYLKALDKQYQNLIMLGYSKDSDEIRKNEKLYREIEGMALSDFLTTMLAYGGDADISFVYDKNQIGERVDRLTDIWFSNAT